MENARQKSFNKLRTPCVALSQVALQFRAKQASVKSVLQCLEKVEAVLSVPGEASNLDPKLAEYVFFPLSHVFNEAQRLSSSCIEVAVRCLHILIARGWRDKLAPEMGQQLLILMVLLAGGPPSGNDREAPTNELKVACYQTIAVIAKCISKSPTNSQFFGDMKSTRIVDQIVYLLLESVSDSTAELVQLEGSLALRDVLGTIQNRSLLASLLPRTVSTIVTATRPQGVGRRKPRVLESNLKLLTDTIRAVLRDEIAFSQDQKILSSLPSNESPGELQTEVLDESWLKATSSQLQIAFAQLSKLRYHDRLEVREALLDLALMTVKECQLSLTSSIRMELEVIIAIASQDDSVGTVASGEMNLLLTTESAMVNEVKSIVYDLSLSLSRIMQSSDDQQKERLISQLRAAYHLLSLAMPNSESLAMSATTTLIEGVTAAVQVPSKEQRIQEGLGPSLKLIDSPLLENLVEYPAILLIHKGEAGSAKCLEDFIRDMSSDNGWRSVARSVINKILDAPSATRVALMWTALRLLRAQNQRLEIEDVIHVETSDGLSSSTPYLISDLYSCALDVLVNNASQPSFDWRLTALSLECVSLQAAQLRQTYRPELIDSLYPVLSLLGSPQPELQMHAIVTLNRLTEACEYASTKALLIENVDYLVNSIAIKLNSFDLSPHGPQVLLVMIRLCGAPLLPYLDDLLDTIFAALDSFHGYTSLVELLFEVLMTMVDESAKQPQLALPDGGQQPDHPKRSELALTIDDICSDLRALQGKQSRSDGEHEERARAFPRRPWSTRLDGPKPESADTADHQSDKVQNDEEDHKLEAMSDEKISTKKPSKSYNLLLSISRATVPHLNSPSPRVRLTLLQLLSRVSPLLSRDEDSFLPLINAVWPVVIGRLFSNIGEDGDGESGYNVVAAAETMTRLCEGAGDFMSSRIEDIFPRLEALFVATSSRARQQGHGKKFAGSHTTGTPTMSAPLHGTVDLQVVPQRSTTGSTVDHVASSPDAASGLSRTTDSQIFQALLPLWVSILNHVRISAEHGESILDMLAPIMDEPGRRHVKEALEAWNADAVWLVSQRKGVAQEVRAGARDSRDRDYQGVGLEDIAVDWRRLGLRAVVF